MSVRIIKLGGSLAHSANLPHWLETLSQHHDECVIIVPGGGGFADQIRSAQTHWQFSDALAHEMAILAMVQYGLMLTGICPALQTARDLFELNLAKRYQATAVWLPAIDWLAAHNIPASWSVTADSLSAWLAATLDADHLGLVKSAPLNGSGMSVRQATDDGLVDTSFADFLSQANCETRLYQQDDWPCYAQNENDTGVLITHPAG